MSKTLPALGLAAGAIKHAHEPSETLLQTAAHVTFGSYTLTSWKGNEDDPMTYWFDHETGDALNAIGLTNQGIEAFLEMEMPAIARIFEESYAKARVSLAPQKAGDLERMCTLIQANPYASCISEFEINAACPNHRGTDGALHTVLAHDLIALEALMKEARVLTYPKAIKIAPEMEKEALKKLVPLCIQYGFQTIVSANTKLSSSVVRGKQRLTKETAGRSGRFLFRRNVRQVKYLAPLCRGTGISLISCGGISTAEDLQTVLDVGANGGQIMTAYLEYQDNIFRDILIGL